MSLLFTPGSQNGLAVFRNFSPFSSGDVFFFPSLYLLLLNYVLNYGAIMDGTELCHGVERNGKGMGTSGVQLFVEALDQFGVFS